MNTMKVYRIHFSDCGTECLMNRKVPKNAMYGEDTTTKRISVCTNIIGCILALQIPYDCCEANIFEGRKEELYLYSAEVPVEKLYQPTEEEVPDVWKTGELWLLEPTRFKLESKLYLRKHMEVQGNLYSKYSITYDGEDEITDRISANAIYGWNKAFSFIARNNVELDGGYFK